MQDPGNVGTIVRISEAFGCKGIFLSKNYVDIYSDKVIRATMGAIFNIPIIQECDIASLISLMKQKQINTCAFLLDTNNILSNFKFKENFGIIIGNESNGINKDILNIVDNKIKIDIKGKISILKC